MTSRTASTPNRDDRRSAQQDRVGPGGHRTYRTHPIGLCPVLSGWPTLRTCRTSPDIVGICRVCRLCRHVMEWGGKDLIRPACVVTFKSGRSLPTYFLRSGNLPRRSCTGYHRVSSASIAATHDTAATRWQSIADSHRRNVHPSNLPDRVTFSATIDESHGRKPRSEGIYTRAISQDLEHSWKQTRARGLAKRRESGATLLLDWSANRPGTPCRTPTLGLAIVDRYLRSVSRRSPKHCCPCASLNRPGPVCWNGSRRASLTHPCAIPV